MMHMDNAWLHDLDSTVLTNASLMSTKYTSSHNAQEGSKLRATNSLIVAILSFLEIDDLPNGLEVLRNHHSVKR